MGGIQKFQCRYLKTSTKLILYRRLRFMSELVRWLSVMCAFSNDIEVYIYQFVGLVSNRKKLQSKLEAIWLTCI